LRHEAEDRQRNAKNDVVFKNRDNNTKKLASILHLLVFLHAAITIFFGFRS
jgi:hypothetical protein